MAGDEAVWPAELAARVDEGARARWREAPRRELGRLGRRLRELGLTERALLYCFGARCPVHAPLRAREGAGERAGEVAPAALMAHLWVAGAAVSEARARARLGADFERLSELGLLACEAGRVWATVAVLPVGDALVVSDRADVRAGRDTALFADDSAFHTLGVVPARASRAPGSSEMRWLDVGTGSALVPLARPGAAGRILGTDIHPRAVAMARLGAALSGVGHLEVAVADLWPRAPGSQPPREWDLITFNAPIPRGAAGGDGPRGQEPWYTYGDAEILSRFWAGVGERLAPRGEVLVHSWQPDADYPDSLELPGQVMALTYTPPGRAPAFGVTCWRPAGPPTCRRAWIELSEQAPHLNRAQLDRAAY